MTCETGKKLKILEDKLKVYGDRIFELELLTELLQVQIRNLYEYIGSQVKLEEIEP